MNDTTNKEETLAEKMQRLSASQEDQTPKTPEPTIQDVIAKADEPQVQEAAPVVKLSEPVKEEVFHVFYHTLPNCNMTLPQGGRVSFVNHRYITKQPHEIAHLQAEIAKGNRRLSVVAGKEVMTATELDPMASLRKAHFEEFKKLQAEAARKIAAGEPLSQSESEAQVLVPGSTDDIASLAAGSGK